MKDSILTLASALSLIPKVKFQRYGGSNDFTFAKSRANAILQDIEKEFDAEYYKRDYPLILLNGVTDYVYDENIRKIRGIYEVPAGWVIPDTRNPISADFLNSRTLRLKHIPTIDSSLDLFGADPTGGFPPAKNKFEDVARFDGSFLGITENSLKSALCVYNFGPNALIPNLIERRIIISNSVTEFSVTLNGDLSYVPQGDNGELYDIIHNYFMLDVIEYITRITDETLPLPIAQDWDELFIAGLRFLYDKQTDMESSQAKSSGSEYNRLLKKASSDEKRRVGAMPKQKPRDIPDFNRHDAATRFGPHGPTF